MKELLNDLNIKHITSLSYKPSSNGQVELFNRAIKGMIMQYMAASNSCRYLEVLPKIVENYNTYHTAIKSTPALFVNIKASHKNACLLTSREKGRMNNQPSTRVAIQ